MQNDPVAALVAKLEQAGFDPRPDRLGRLGIALPSP